MITSGTYNGHPWKYSQAVIDTALYAASRGIVWYGLGDTHHWQGSGDHISINNDHPGWITAIDVMDGPEFDAPETMHGFLVPTVASTMDYSQGYCTRYPELKYVICDYELRDTRKPYNWSKQSGGDGPDHVHLSFRNNYSLHSQILAESFGETVTNQGADMAMVDLADGRVAVVARGTDNNLYVRVLTHDAGALTDWMKIGVKCGSPVDACTRTGFDLAIATLDPKDRSVLLITIANAVDPVNPYTQDLGGKGIGGAPGIAATENGDLFLSVAGTGPRKGEIYLNRWDSQKRAWRGWWDSSGQAA